MNRTREEWSKVRVEAIFSGISDYGDANARVVMTMMLQDIEALHRELFEARALLFSYGVSTINRDPLAHITSGKVT
jgi:hypothetical protein